MTKPHDVSQEKRDESGKWTTGGSSSQPPTHDDIAAAAADYAKNGTRAKAFRAWFGDSKVVDAKGEPEKAIHTDASAMPVYHGTNENFESFSFAKNGKTDHGHLGKGFYFTTNKATAESYAKRHGGNTVLQCYLSIKNPYVTKHKYAPPKGVLPTEEWRPGFPNQGFIDNKVGAEAFTKHLQSLGHDGVCWLAPDGSKEWIAFEPTQIKSAANQGTFNPTDDRISLSHSEKPSAADRLVANVISRAEAAGYAISSEIRRETLAVLRRLTKSNPDPRRLMKDFLMEFRLILRRYEPILARSASDAQFAAWLEGGGGVLRDLELPGAIPETLASAWGLPQNPASIVTYPAMEEDALIELAAYQILTADEFYAEADRSRQDGFTVARTASLDALEKMRDALAEAVVDEVPSPKFRIVAAGALDSSRLAPQRQEVLMRTPMMQKYALGQKAVVEHPLVQSVAVFVLRSEIADSRLTPLCEALSHCGIEGTAIYFVQDMVWRLVAPPSHHSCRCGAVYLTIDRAAARGLKVAQKWLATGIRPPDSELFVPVPDVVFPPGWKSPWAV